MSLTFVAFYASNNPFPSQEESMSEIRIRSHSLVLENLYDKIKVKPRGLVLHAFTPQER
jgi:hypothetical protein